MKNRFTKILLALLMAVGIVSIGTTGTVFADSTTKEAKSSIQVLQDDESIIDYASGQVKDRNTQFEIYVDTGAYAFDEIRTLIRKADVECILYSVGLSKSIRENYDIFIVTCKYYEDYEILTDDDSITKYIDKQVRAGKTEFTIHVYEGHYDEAAIGQLVYYSHYGDVIYRVGANYSQTYYGVEHINLFLEYNEEGITLELVEQYETKLAAVMQQLNLKGKTEFYKVKAIHDYICDNVDYDYEHYESEEYYKPMYTRYAALLDGTAVCQGYAELFEDMCNMAGLSSYLITGVGNGGAHAWNIVKIGKEYYNIDVTWDGQDKETHHAYFLKSETDFGNHTRNSSYSTAEFYKKYPMATRSWMDFESFNITEGLNKDNLSETLYTTVFGGTVTNQAEGRPKVLVFGNLDGCPYTVSTIKALAKVKFDDVDIIAIHANDATLERVLELEKMYVDGAFPVAYNLNNTGNASMWKYIRDIFGNELSSITYPVIVYIDAENKVHYAEYKGYFSPEHIRDMVDTYIAGNEAVELSYDKITLESGDTKQIGIKLYGKDANGQFFTWSSSNTSVAKIDENGIVKGVGKGKAVITCKFNSKISLTCEVEVKEKLSVTTKVSNMNTVIGDTITFTATAKGGTGTYTYSLIVYNEKTEKWARIKDNVTSNKFTWKAESTGSRLFYIDVKDSSGKTVRCEAMRVVTNDKLSVTAKSSVDVTIVGDKVTFTADATGGTGGYTYSLIVYNETTKQWARVKDNITSNTMVWKAGSIGTRSFYIDVKDSSGKTVRSSAIKIETAKTRPLSITASSSASSVSVGSKVKISAVATGGTGEYTYSFIVKNEATGKWYRYDFDNPSYLNWKPSSAGKRTFYVEVKDSDGNVLRSKAVVINVK